MFSAKNHEFETSYRRRIVTNQKYPLKALGILHVPANEVQHMEAMGRLLSVGYPSAN